MVKVFIDFEKLSNLYSGLGQFCFNLGQSFQNNFNQNIELAYYLPALYHKAFGDSSKYIFSKKIHQLTGIPNQNFSVWHCTHQESKFFPKDKNTKVILTIHDLNFLYKYKGIKQKIKLKQLQNKIDRCSVITTISEFTKKEIQQHLNIGNKEIKVICNGVSLKEEKEISLPKILIENEFIFSIGIISEKKNFHVLLHLLKHNPKLHLVIAGNNSNKYATQIIDKAKELNLESRLHLIGIIDEPTKFSYYKNCKAFVFPSFSEGFGLPVIEAMSLGKPVFLSTATSLPEVGGKEAYYWNNFDANEMNLVFQNGMNNYYNDKEKSARIKNWASQFTWQKAAKEYLKVYTEIS